MKKSILIGVSSFVLGAALFIGLSSTLAANSTTSNGLGLGKGPEISQENRDALENAFQNSDYGAWKTIIEQSGNKAILEKINESNFARFAEAHRIMKEAREKAQVIFKELGVEGLGNGLMGPHDKGKGPMMTEEQRTAIDTAINNGDYTAWKAAIGENNPMAQEITAENFAKFAEANKLMKTGDVAGAKVIFDELGIKKGFGKGGRGPLNNQNTTQSTTN